MSTAKLGLGEPWLWREKPANTKSKVRVKGALSCLPPQARHCHWVLRKACSKPSRGCRPGQHSSRCPAIERWRGLKERWGRVWRSRTSPQGESPHGVWTEKPWSEMLAWRVQFVVSHLHRSHCDKCPLRSPSWRKLGNRIHYHLRFL